LPFKRDLNTAAHASQGTSDAPPTPYCLQLEEKYPKKKVGSFEADQAASLARRADADSRGLPLLLRVRLAGYAAYPTGPTSVGEVNQRPVEINQKPVEINQKFTFV
jgi:hypothetical protein